jgi:hypothetical protein
MSNRGCLFNGRNQTCDLLVSDNIPLLIVHSDVGQQARPEFFGHDRVQPNI